LTDINPILRIGDTHLAKGIVTRGIDRDI
jgi:hypothetical protein